MRRLVNLENDAKKVVLLKSVAILPAYNLEHSISTIVERTKKYVDTVIVVSDGSKDETNLNALKAGAVCPPHSLNRGKGYAVRKGIELSKKYNPKYIVLMDADGQHLPEEIPIMLAPLEENLADMVAGSRMKGTLKTSTINKIGNIFLIIISFFVTGRFISDTETGFRALMAEKLYELELNTTYYEIDSELLIKSLYKKYKVVEVPITIPKAVPGVTVMDGLKIGLYKIRIGLSLKLGL